MAQFTPRAHPMPRVSEVVALAGPVLHRRVQVMPQWAWPQEQGNMFFRLQQIVTQTPQTQSTSDRLPVSSF